MANIAIFALFSCTSIMDDMDILSIGESSLQLEQIMEYSEGISETALRQMTNSFLRNTGRKELAMTKEDLTSSDFLGTGQACFPAYSESMAYFDLFPYDSLKNDTLKFHFSMKYLEEYIDSILNDDIDYKVYEMKWKHKGNEVTTLALYDSNDGLVYDNILFNIINVCHISDLNKNKKLSRSENIPNEYYTSGSEYVFSSSSYGLIRAEAWLWWYEYGHMGSAPIYDANGNIVRIIYYYVHDRLLYDFDQWSNYNYSTITRLQDFSNSSEANFTYCVWAGPTMSMPDVDHYLSNYIPGLYIDLSGTTNSFPITFYQGMVNSVNYQVSSYTEPYP